MDEMEPFDWSPEVNLVKGLSPRVGAVLEYVRAARERSAARRRMFVSTVIEASGLDAEALATRLRDDEDFAALFETALDASARSAYEQKLSLLARVVAQAASDTASIDDAQLTAATICDLEPPHVRALTVLAGYKLEHPDATGVASVIEHGRRPGAHTRESNGIIRSPASPDEHLQGRCRGGVRHP